MDASAPAPRNGEQHPLTLRFVDPALERAFGDDLRAGIHTGPVVAGVIGRRRFSFDLWGDTVNTASRMESHGMAGRIQISAAVRDRLGDRFAVEERGPVSVKGKGEMLTFLVMDR